MTKVLEARRAFDDAKAQAKEAVARKRAQYGKAMVEARAAGDESQESIARQLELATNQVRRYEQAYRDWKRDHDDQEPD